MWKLFLGYVRIILDMKTKEEEKNMENTLKIAYSEVDQVLDILGEKYKQEVPTKIRDMISREKDVNHKITINKIDDIHLTRKALIILSIFNLKYWEKDKNNIENLKQHYYNNERKYQEKINQYKEKDWLQSKKSDDQVQENHIGTSLIEIDNTSFISKIKRFLKKLIHRRK